MPYRKEAKDCFSCRNAGIFYSKAGPGICIICPDRKCFEQHFRANMS